MGIIGLGPMGGNIAQLLLGKGFKVVGFDIERARALELIDNGMIGGLSVNDVAEKANILITHARQLITRKIDSTCLVKSIFARCRLI